MLSKEKNEPEELQLNDGLKAVINRGKGVVKFIHDGEKSGKDNLPMLELISEQTNLPIFKGEVEHAYESDFLGYKHKCPRCGSATVQMVSNFAYSTQKHSRLNCGPAGHFCKACPTVIIDDDFIRDAIDSSRFVYRGVFTVETGYSDKPVYFKTMNGKPTLYLLNEMEDVEGIAQSVHQAPLPPGLFQESAPKAAPKAASAMQQNKKAKNRSKNKQAKRSRRKNRGR